MTQALKQLSQELAEAQDALLNDSEALARVHERLLSVPPRWQRLRRLRRQLLVAGVVTSAVAALLIWKLPATIGYTIDGRQSDQSDRWLSSSHEPLDLNFSDGSNVELAPRSGAWLQDLGSNSATVSLTHGEVNLAIKPSRSRRTPWRVRAGPFTVAVVGTRFRVTWKPEAGTFSVAVSRGKVKVSGPQMKDRAVGAGESLRILSPEKAASLATQDDSGASHQDEGRAAFGHTKEDLEPTTSPQHLADQPTLRRDELRSSKRRPQPGRKPTSPGAGESSAASSLSWKALAEAGRYREAISKAQAVGLEEILAQASVEDLRVLGHAARLAPKRDIARTAYRTIRRRFAQSPDAAEAAFFLGRLALDHEGAPGAAATWFEAYLKEAPKGAFCREALGRLIEAERRAGHMKAARKVAESYLDRFPKGPHAHMAQALLRR